MNIKGTNSATCMFAAQFSTTPGIIFSRRNTLNFCLVKECQSTSSPLLVISINSNYYKSVKVLFLLVLYWKMWWWRCHLKTSYSTWLHLMLSIWAFNSTPHVHIALAPVLWQIHIIYYIYVCVYVYIYSV